MAEVSDRKNGGKRWDIINDGEITFTYKEAKMMGISTPTFARAIDQLVRFGFIEIKRTGQGLCKSTTHYAFSGRWRNYGTDKFIEKFRPKKRRYNAKIGFQDGHQYYPPNGNNAN